MVQERDTERADPSAARAPSRPFSPRGGVEDGPLSSPSTYGGPDDGGQVRQPRSRRGIATVAAIFALPLAMYLISIAVNLAFPAVPSTRPGIIKRSLVQIAVGTSADDIAPAGTGFAVSSDGYVMTSRQVVFDESTALPKPRVLVKLPDGLVVQAHLAGSDDHLELALIKVDGVLDLWPIKWGDPASCDRRPAARRRRLSAGRRRQARRIAELRLRCARGARRP